MHKKIILVILLSITVLAQGADIKVIKAKRYLDVRRGRYVQPANIIVTDDKIVAINPKQLPKGIPIIDKPELTLLPGLMDMHVHITGEVNPQFELEIVQTDGPMDTLIGVNNAKKLLMAGFTTVRDLGQFYPGIDFVTVALARASENGWIEAPHIIPAGHALSITGGHMDPSGYFAPEILKVDYRMGVADGVDEVIKATRYQIEHGAKVIKVAATAGVLSNEDTVGAQQYSFDELKAIVDEANRHGIFVTVHAHGTEGIKASIRAGVRSVEHGSILDDEAIHLFKQHGTYLVPTAYTSKIVMEGDLPPIMAKKARLINPLSEASLRSAIKAGVKIAFGTDSAVFPHGLGAKEFSVLVDDGLTPIKAIQAATTTAAEMMNLKDRGELKEGLTADIIGVKGDPLRDVSSLEYVNFVMKSGHVYK